MPKKKLVRKKKKPVQKSVSVNFLLDETGSMNSCLDATITGFNEYINGLRKKNQKVKFTLTKFDSNHITKLCDDVDLKAVPELNRDNYVPGAMTPLYDAIGKTLNEIPKRKRNVLCVIMTDGEENASKEYNQSKIAEMIKEREGKGWTFAYLGANQDAWANARQFGFKKGNTMNYHTGNTRAVFDGLQIATECYVASAFTGQSMACCDSLLADNMDEDALSADPAKKKDKKKDDNA